MSIERQQRIFELLDEVLDLPSGERSAFLEAHCTDAEMRREVELMMASEPTAPVLEAPAFSVHAGDPALGRQIGDYRIVELLGRGGMGSVYLAEREHFDQRVALKLLRRGLDLDQVLVRRFHNERQILAHLDHPNVARLFDGGTTEDFLPYFVMEYVEGVPIDRYCEREELSIAARLRLFRKVCAAVQFAHRSLVVHRDLKPGNVLITAGGEPKLLDFGIAKLLDHRLGVETLATATGHGAMTPRYASPEQIRLEPITTASDVYSLGVMLYELLTGRTPYRLATDRSDEVARAVCEQEPEKPSTAVRRAAGETRDTIADPRRLRQLLSGDLDSIVLKALRKKPENRYDSVDQLSEDLRRYLDGEPVSARVGTSLYRFGKFVRRFWLPLSVLAAFVLLSTGFGIVSMKLRQEALKAGQEAVEAGERSDAILEFLKGLIRKARPQEAGGKEMSASELLQRGVPSIREEFGDDPKIEIELLGTLSQLLFELGKLQDARELIERSLEKARAFYGEEHPEVAERMNNWGAVLIAQGEYDEAESVLRRALEMRKALGQKDREVFRTRGNFATSFFSAGQYERAKKLYRDLLDSRLAVNERDDLDVATSHRNLGTACFATRDLEGAERHLREALRIRETLLGKDHAEVASVLDPLGRVMAAKGDAPAAERFLRRALDVRSFHLPENHELIARTKTHLAALLVREAPDGAGLLLDQALAAFASSGSGERDVAVAESVLGELLMVRGRFEEAEVYLRESHLRLAKSQGPEAVPTRQAHRRVVDLYMRWNRPDELGRFLAMHPGPSDQRPDAPTVNR